jgi:hypothetical protein
LTEPVWIDISEDGIAFDEGSTYSAELSGDTISLQPGCYNTLQSVQGNDNGTYTTTLTMTHTKTTVTPRWSIP